MTKNILFSGVPDTPSHEVFAAVRAKWSPERKKLQEAFEAFQKSPVNKGSVPKNGESGATLEQVYYTIKLLGAEKYCLLSTDQAEVPTGKIPKIIKMSSEQLVKSLKQIQNVDGNVLSTLLHFDGHTGHCIVLDWYDQDQNRFFYRDPWPLDSLLCEKNNIAGVNAKKEEENYWSITDDELTSVIFAVFVYPGQWGRAQKEIESLQLDVLRTSDFFSFFHLEEIAKYEQKNKIEVQYSPSNLKGIVVVSLLVSSSNRITEAIILMNKEWMKQNFMLVPDITRSFLKTFVPSIDIKYFSQIFESLHPNNINQMLPALMQMNADTADFKDAFLMSFFGILQSTRDDFNYSILSVDNEETNGIPSLKITIVLP